MVNGIATRLQEENRQLRGLIREMQAILKEATDNRYHIESARWWAAVNAVVARAEALGITTR